MMLLVGIGGAFGAIIRVFLGETLSKLSSTQFPYATLIINITGAFFLGFLWQLYQHQVVTEWVWTLIGVGFLGAYTTFSTFSVEAVKLCLNHQLKLSVLYVFISIILGIIGVYLGSAII